MSEGGWRSSIEAVMLLWLFFLVACSGSWIHLFLDRGGVFYGHLLYGVSFLPLTNPHLIFTWLSLQSPQ